MKVGVYGVGLSFYLAGRSRLPQQRARILKA
jgi:hypothetical protein